MRKSERDAVLRLVRHMQDLQRQIVKPTLDDATDDEVKTLFRLLWEWTDKPNQPLPSKHAIENLVALMRGLEHGYCYIGRQDVARIIRELADDNELGRSLSVRLGKGWRTMSDLELYEKGRWNYKRTPLVDLLYNLHCNPWMFLNID